MNKSSDKLIYKSAILSFSVGLVILGLKLAAYFHTSSAAILSDALESIVHVAATGFVVFCVHYSQKPPDEDHPFGHGRIENFSVGFEGGLIFVAGLAIFWESIRNLVYKNEIHDIDTGFYLIILAGVINTVLGIYLLRVGKKTNSDIITADGKHVLADVWTSVAIVAGLILIWLTGWIFLDTVIAFAVAIHLAWSGFKLLREAVVGLMDKAEPETLEKIVEAINEVRNPDWFDIHNLRVHSVGDQKHVDFHLVIPSKWTIDKAHETMDHLEDHILNHLGCRGSVLVHLDPYLDRETFEKLNQVSCPTEVPFNVQSATRMVQDSETDKKHQISFR